VHSAGQLFISGLLFVIFTCQADVLLLHFMVFGLHFDFPLPRVRLLLQNYVIRVWQIRDVKPYMVSFIPEVKIFFRVDAHPLANAMR